MTITQTSKLDFVAQNYSVWGPGVSSGFDFTLPKNDTTINESYNTAPNDNFDGIPLSASASFDAGISGTLAATLGSFDINYPVTVNAQYPTSVPDGQTFSINTSNYRINNASLDLLGPGLAANLNLFLNANLSLNVANFLDANFSTNFNKSFNLLQPIDLSGVTLAAPAPFSADGQAQSATDSLVALSTLGTGGPFLSATLDLPDLAAGLLGLPPPNGSFSALGVSFDYTLLAIDLNASLSLGQAVTFTPTAINVDMSYGGQTDPSGTLGNTFEFTAPSSGSGVMNVTATYTLEGEIQTTTGVVGNFGLDASALGLSGSASLGPFQVSGSLGPLVNYASPT